MRKNLLPKSLLGLTLIGFEDETPEQKAAREAAEATEENDDEDEDEGGDGDKGKENKDDTDGLKSALAKERSERKKFEREVKALRKKQEVADSKDQSETDQAKTKAAAADAKAVKLAERLNRTAVDNVILKLAPTLKFRDLDDALSLIKRADLIVDQDEEDPSEIEIDEDSVLAALNDLAKKKPHLIVAEGQEDKSGSKFNGGKKSTGMDDDAMLRATYPALRHSTSSS